MMVGARTGAWAKAGGGVPTARDYVQDGLVAMWDGIENAGWGVHDPNAMVWKDLSENGWDFSLNPNMNRASFGDKYFDMKQVSSNGNDVWAAYTNKGYIGNGYSCLEIVYYPYNSVMDIFNPGGGVTMENPDYGFYASLSFIQFGTERGKDRWRYAFDSSVNKPYCAACNIYTSPTIKHIGFVNGVEVNRTDSNATSGYYRGLYTSIGGRYPYTDWGASGRIYALRLHNRFLTAAEIAANYAIDKARFNLP